jgi:hypothetical protein
MTSAAAATSATDFQNVAVAGCVGKNVCFWAAVTQSAAKLKDL